MKLLPFFAIALTWVLAARADIVIEQKVESAALNGNMVLKVRADKARIDMPSLGGPMTVIWNFKAGEMITLMSAQKIAMKGTIRPKQETEAPRPKATGVTEKVGPYTAEVYEFIAGPATQKVWVAKDYPDAEVLKGELKKMSGATPMGFDTSNLDVPGMAVKFQVASPAGPVTVTLVSAKQQAVADREFAIPAGYKEMGMGAPNSGSGTASSPGTSPATGAAPSSVAPLATPAPRPTALSPATALPTASAATNVPAKARRHWEGRFNELDKNSDGKLSLEEFLAGPMGKKTPEKARTFFQTMDKNHTGAITMDQFVGAEADREGESEPAHPAGIPDTRAVGGTASPSPLVIVTGVVRDHIDQGLLIQTPRGPLVWLGATDARVGSTVEMSAVKTEPHVYTAANGNRQTIEGYRASLTGR